MKKEIRNISLINSCAAMFCVIISMVASIFLNLTNTVSLYLENIWFNFFITSIVGSFIAVFLPFFISDKIIINKYIPDNKIKYNKKNGIMHSIEWIFFGLFLIMATNIVNSIFSQFLTSEGFTDPNASLFKANNVIDYILIFLSVCVVAPVLEELTFRYYLLKELKKYGNTFAILMSAFFFGIIHGNFYQMFFGFAVGIILAFIFLKTENIFIPIIIHMINNSFALFSFFSDGNFKKSLILSIMISEFFVIIIGGFISFLAIKKQENLSLKTLIKKLKNQNKKIYFYYLVPYTLIPLITYGVISEIKK